MSTFSYMQTAEVIKPTVRTSKTHLINAATIVTGVTGVPYTHSKTTRSYRWHTTRRSVFSWQKNGARRPVSATSTVTSKIKGEGRKVTWRVWQVLADKSRTKRPINTKIGGKVTHPTGNNAYMFQGQRSKVKVTWSVTLHNNTSFRTTIAFYSHL